MNIFINIDTVTINRNKVKIYMGKFKLRKKGIYILKVKYELKYKG